MLAEAKDATIASKSWFAVRLPRCFERMQIPKINPNRLESEVGVPTRTNWAVFRRVQTNMSATIMKIPNCAASQQIGRIPAGAKA
jgi:hypothetical protein